MALALSSLGPWVGGAVAATTVTPPSVTHNAWSGQTLQLTQGTYSGVAPTITQDEWFRCTDPAGTDSGCTDTGVDAQSYPLGGNDVGYYMKVEETETDLLIPTTVSSNVTFQVTAGAPVADQPPTIADQTSGTATVTVGDTIGGVSDGTWHAQLADGTWEARPPDSISYQWRRCSNGSCPLISGATGTTYTTTHDDIDTSLELAETPTYGPTTLDTENASAPTAAVLPLPPSNTSAPSISGTAAEGYTLTADPGSWSNNPTSYAYAWSRCDASGQACTPIGGATGQAYAATGDDVGHTLVVAVSGVNAGGTGSAVNASPSGLVTTASSASVGVSPSAPVANQTVTLTAVITPHAAGGVTAGAVRFSDANATVGGCGAQPVIAGPQGATATCQTTFPAGVELITATFSPSAASAATGSVSAPARVFVGRDTTTTSLDITRTVKVGARTTFTATVTHQDLPGPLTPAGTVEFMDAGKPIAGCATQSLVAGGATCTTRYTRAGGHSIRARFGGDANFLSSSSPIRPLRVTKLKAKGRITATMQWTFHYTPSYTEVLAMVINGVPRGGVVQVKCSGKGCPFAVRTTTVRKGKRCTKRKRSACPAPGRVSLTGPFRRHHLKVGAQITILIRRPQYIGKYYSFRVRARHQPRVRIDCLGLDATKPGAGC